MSIAMPVVESQPFVLPGHASRGASFSNSDGSVTAPAPAAPNAEPVAARTTLGANGRLKVEELTDTDRTCALIIHLSPFAAVAFGLALFTPLVVWLVKKDKSAFIDDHGREMVNMLITCLIVWLAGTIATLMTIGIGAILIIPAVAAWHLIIIINQIRAALAVGRGEYFRYPMTIRFL